jgi:hypothetical protein
MATAVARLVDGLVRLSFSWVGVVGGGLGLAGRGDSGVLAIFTPAGDGDGLGLAGLGESFSPTAVTGGGTGLGEGDGLQAARQQHLCQPRIRPS